jgi:hypothetical protein
MFTIADINKSYKIYNIVYFENPYMFSRDLLRYALVLLSNTKINVG